jgi:ABC-type transporter Mla subunit MlaD
VKRLTALVLVVIAGAGLGFAALARGGSGGGTGLSNYRVDVVFDDARGLQPGQLLEIAGGRAGTISAVTLTDRYRRALVELDVDPRFAPFRTTARCTIRPQGLIAENYVACDPGEPPAPALRESGGRPATVPVEHTTEPVTLPDLFNIATLPTRERLTVLSSELGVGVTARGEDINAILRRANPSLALARRAIAILESQRTQLATTIDATDPLVAQLAAHRAQARGFMAAAARVTARLAAHRAALAGSVQRLPALLSATRPALAQLDLVETQTTPLLVQLGAAAPLLSRLSVDLGPLVAAARPALARLGHALRFGASVARQVTPSTEVLARYARNSLPTALLTDRLTQNLERTGFYDYFLRFIYYAAASMARFDAISHILPAHVAINQCGQYATAPVAGCTATYHARASASAAAAPSGRSTWLEVLRYLLR